MENNNSYECCICGKHTVGYGNNPYPVKDEGRCCDKCNEKVILARVAESANKLFSI